MMTPLVIGRGLVAFPAAWISGAEYAEVREKARDFVYSAARVTFACSIIWGLYKGQRCEMLRSLNMPLLTMRVGRFSLSLEPLSLLINLYLMKTVRSKFALAVNICGLGIWQSVARIFYQWKVKPSTKFFAADIRRVKIDSLVSLSRVALWKMPETRLGIGLSTLIFGIYQLYVYTYERWDLKKMPTDLPLKGIVHVVFGLGWLGAYENYHAKLEKSGMKKTTYFYRAAEWLAPHLAWLATGRRESLISQQLSAVGR